MRARTNPLLAVLVVAVLAATGSGATAIASPSASTAGSTGSNPVHRPPIRHVFVINLENKGYDDTFGPGSQAPYLAHTLRDKGQLLTQYYGTAHNSLPNYLAQVSGPGAQQADPGRLPGLLRLRAGRHGRAAAGGRGRLCLPLERADHRQPAAGAPPDLARLPGGHGRGLPHPAANTPDGTQKATGRETSTPPRHKPLRLLQGRHRHAVVRPQRRRPEQAARRPAASEYDAEPDLPHPRPVQ